MTGVKRAAVVAGVAVAVALTLARASEGDAMTRGFVRGSQSVAEGVRWVAVGTGRAVAGLFNRVSDRGAAPAYTRQQSRDESNQEVDFVWRGVVETGQTLQIKGVNGDIIAGRASGTEIEVRAEKRARRSDVDDVRIEVVEHADGVTLCAVYPSSRGRENTCEPGSGGGNSVRNVDVQVTFYVSVPANVTFLGSTVNGDVEVEDLASDVDVSSVNGDIEISTTGFAEATTVNGSIDAAMEQYDIENGLSFTTVNGSISLDLPDDVDADLDARWLNGRLEADLPFERIGRVSRRSARGVLGDGGPELHITTVNGSIHIY